MTGVGVAPEGVRLFWVPATLGSLCIGGRPLFLRVEKGQAQLKASEVKLEFTSPRGCELQLLWMTPAKSEESSESLFDPATNSFRASLLDAEWSNLHWLRGLAHFIAQALQLGVRERDLGSDA